MALLDWARTADALVIEDGCDAELRYDRQPIGAARPVPQRVVGGGSVGKVVGSARLGSARRDGSAGWLVTPSWLFEDVHADEARYGG